MPTVDIQNVPRDNAELQDWSFAHMTQHRDINRKIMEVYNIRVDEFSLDPIPIDSMDIWLDQHQQMHNQQNKILKISGNALVDVNWKDNDELEEWIWMHADEHNRAATILGI